MRVGIRAYSELGRPCTTLTSKFAFSTSAKKTNKVGRPGWADLKVPLWLAAKIPYKFPTAIQIAALKAFKESEQRVYSGTSTPNTDPAIEEPRVASDLVIQDITGSGKTLAYLVPILLGVNPNFSELQAVIVLPTRELATQVSLVIDKFELNKGGKREGARLNTFLAVGEANAYMLERMMLKPPQVLIGTAEVLNDLFWEQQRLSYLFSTPEALIDISFIKLEHVKYIVFDEVDYLLTKKYSQFIYPFLDARIFNERVMQRKSSSNHPQISNNNNNNYIQPQQQERGPLDPDFSDEDDYLYGSEVKHDPIWMQTFFVSATITDQVKKVICDRYTANTPVEFIKPLKEHIKRRPRAPRMITEDGTVSNIENVEFEVPQQVKHYYTLVDGGMSQRVEALVNVLEGIREQFKASSPDATQTTLVFFRIWHPFMIELADELKRRKFKVGTLSENSRRSERRESLKEARNVILSTDILSRGIDIPHLTHVVNFDFPRGDRAFVENVYLHRSGRVGRTGSKHAKDKTANMVVSIVTGRELDQLKKASKSLNFHVDKVGFRNGKFVMKSVPSLLKK